MSTYTTQDFPERPLEIPLCLEDFMRSIEDQSKTIEQLSVRLESLMNPSKSDGLVSKDMSPPISALAARIHDLNIGMIRNTDRLRNMIAALEI